MPVPKSKGLGVRSVAAVRSGAWRPSAAKRYGVSSSAAIRWSNLTGKKKRQDQCEEDGRKTQKPADKKALVEDSPLDPKAARHHA